MKYLTQENIDEAYDILKANGVLAFPTETVYGLGIIANSEKNLAKLIQIKKRSDKKPFTLMCSRLDQVSKYVESNSVFNKLSKAFFPGEITIITKCKNNTPRYLDFGTGYIGIRIPNNEFILKVLDKLEEPLFVPSANISDFEPALNSDEVYNYFKEDIDGIVVGEVGSKVPSTVVQIINDKIKIIRKGKITKNQIKEALK